MYEVLFSLLFAIFSVEYFYNLPFVKQVAELQRIFQISTTVLSSKRISDHWKEKVLLQYAKQILLSTLFLALLLSGLLLVLYGTALLLDQLFSNSLHFALNTLQTPQGWLWMSLFSFLYYYLRHQVKSVPAQSEYSFSERFLHRLAFGSPQVAQMSFEFEQLFCANSLKKQDGNPVFINGLARSGTTILKRIFHSTEQFRSLSYRDMPFVLMPGLWKKLSTPFHLQQETKERAHGDGIHFNVESPEAFEEVFWKTYAANNYLFADHLTPHTASKELIEQFRLFVRHVIASADAPQETRYLSKNNNNILRLSSIRQAFPESLIIVIFRNPLQQAFSLLQQHIQFSQQHDTDVFGQDYMEWLGHHEFGKTHRIFRFGEQWNVCLENATPDNINYWLALWINTYRYLLDTSPKDAVFVAYEELCNQPEKVLKILFLKANLTCDSDTLSKTIKPLKEKAVTGVHEALQQQAMQTYAHLLKRAGLSA